MKKQAQQKDLKAPKPKVFVGTPTNPERPEGAGLTAEGRYVIPRNKNLPGGEYSGDAIMRASKYIL